MFMKECYDDAVRGVHTRRRRKGQPVFVHGRPNFHQTIVKSMDNFKQPFRVLFVCLGNICRSPAAEIIFNATALKSGLGGCVLADSCGTASYHVGSRPDPRMLAALSRAGFRYGGHLARAFRREDFARFDLIIPQDHENAADLLQWAGSPCEKEKVAGMWKWFAPEEPEREVPDPYYGSASDFDAVVGLLERSMQRLASDIRQRLGWEGEA